MAFQVLLGMSTGRAATRFGGGFLGEVAAAGATFGTVMAWASGSCSTSMDACTSIDDGPASSCRTHASGDQWLQGCPSISYSRKCSCCGRPAVSGSGKGVSYIVCETYRGLLAYASAQELRAIESTWAS